MFHNVFISFSSKDIETALRIYEGLSNRAVKCWISSKHVSPGGNFMNEIVSALTSSSVMILIYSHNANLSKEIERELALAGQHQLTVIPLKIDDVVPSGAFVYSLATSQWVEVFPNIESTLDTVATTIKAITDRTEKFALEVQQALEEDGVIEPTDQKYLEDEVGVRMGLTAAQSRAIIKRVVGDSTQSTSQDRELDYLKLIAEVLEDGKITSLERRRLADRAKSLRINESRAETLLKQEEEKNGIKSVASPPPIAPESVLNLVDEGGEVERNSRPNIQTQVGVEVATTNILEQSVTVEPVDSSNVISPSSSKSGFSSSTGDNAPSNQHMNGDVASPEVVESDQYDSWEYFKLGTMKVLEVLESSELDDLASYICFYAFDDDDIAESVIDKLKSSNPTSIIADAIEEYAQFLDPDVVGNYSVAIARDWSMARIIAKLIATPDMDLIKNILSKGGNTKIRNAFIESWPDGSEDDDFEEDDELDTEYNSLGAMKAIDVLEHDWSSDLISYIAEFSGKTKQTVKKYLSSAEDGQQVMDVVKGYREFSYLSNLAGYNVKFANDFELARVIADALKLTDIAPIEAILASTNGHTLLKKAFFEYWPK